MGKAKMSYPMIDDKREKRVTLSSERLLYGEDSYFFSPKFKRSREILQAVIRGYVSKRGILSGDKTDFVVRPDFKRDTKNKIKEVLNGLQEKDGISISEDEILVFLENCKRKILLTADSLYSDYGRDKYDEKNDRKGFYVKCLLKDIVIKSNKIKSDDGEVYRFDRVFSREFISLFEELKELNKEIKMIPINHPLSKEKRSVRENYLAILVDKCLEDGSLTANEVVRLEILARQIGIDSMSLSGMVQDSLGRFETSKKTGDYVEHSLNKLDHISKEYRYMLYHDVITFDLLSNKNNVLEQFDEFGEFSKELAGICDFEDSFNENYTKAMQKLVVSSYLLRDTIRKRDELPEDQEAFANLCKSIEYEYNLQKELLK